MKTGKRIYDLRSAAGLTQDELAGRLFVSRSLVALWESGRRRPDAKMAERMAAVFGVPPETLREDDPKIRREIDSCLPAGAEADDERLTALLDSFLDSIPEKERCVFVRRYHFLESRAQIAERYGLSPGHVSVILFRTKKKLKRFMEERT